jgi:hypothetical protein
MLTDDLPSSFHDLSSSDGGVMDGLAMAGLGRIEEEEGESQDRDADLLHRPATARPTILSLQTPKVVDDTAEKVRETFDEFLNR